MYLTVKSNKKLKKMQPQKRLSFDLAMIAEAFELERSEECIYLKEWFGSSFELNDFEQHLVDKIHKEISVSSNYLNEEELKIRLIAPLFEIADIDTDNKIRVFYERSLSEIRKTSTNEEYKLSVICDCMIASSTIFKTPQKPYFFLQEFKKAKGEKNDPEAQMLVAMLAAQQSNQDNNVIYGGFLIGSSWQFATLQENQYCTSRIYQATDKDDLLQIIYAMRNLKDIILNRK